MSNTGVLLTETVLRDLVASGTDLEELFNDICPKEGKNLSNAIARMQNAISRIREYFPDAVLYYEGESGLHVLGCSYKGQSIFQRDRLVLYASDNDCELDVGAW